MGPGPDSPALRPSPAPAQVVLYGVLAWSIANLVLPWAPAASPLEACLRGVHGLAQVSRNKKNCPVITDFCC